MKRNVISINEELCNGCGNCVSGCHEGALQLIDGKARLINYLYCDGLGACIGECPQNAISIEEKDVEEYSEEAVMQKIVSKGEETIIAHLAHLKRHNEMGYLDQGLEYLRKNNISINLDKLNEKVHSTGEKNHGSCPGSLAQNFEKKISDCNNTEDEEKNFSELQHWPIQLHLLNPQSGFLKNADMVLCADCVAYSYGNFHKKFLKNKKIAIACPKLDSDKEVYIDKIVSMIDDASIKSLQVIIMQVPCCSSLFQIAKIACDRAKRKISLTKTIISLEGEILE